MYRLHRSEDRVFLTGLMISSIILLGLLVVISIWRQITKAGKSRHGGLLSTRENAKPANPYRAISIRASTACCVAIGDTEGERYLVEDNNVPDLPHAVCGSDKCACKYIYHDDRRSGDDRRSIFGVSRNLHIQTGHVENRSNGGRRNSDDG